MQRFWKQQEIDCKRREAELESLGCSEKGASADPPSDSPNSVDEPNYLSVTDAHSLSRPPIDLNSVGAQKPRVNSPSTIQKDQKLASAMPR